MATRSVWKVLAGCQRQMFNPIPCPQRTVPIRSLTVVRRKTKKPEPEKKEEKKKEKRVIDDTGRHKPYGKTAWVPVDDVYLIRYYPRTLYDPAAAVDLLKTYQRLDFTPPDQPVYVDLKLDMKLEKKKRVDPFVSTLQLPHRFKTQLNRVLVFTEDSDAAKLAVEQGAALAGGAELIQPILEDEVSADFYLTTPEMLPKLFPLKNKLRKSYPKSKKGTVGTDVSKMLRLFLTGHSFFVEEECYIRTQISTLDAPSDHILENLQTVLTDVRSRKPAEAGPFIERAILSSRCSEAVWLNLQKPMLLEPTE